MFTCRSNFEMSITLTLNGFSSPLIANYFPPIVLDQNYVCGLISFDTYHSIPNVDIENNLFHIGNHVIEIPVGSYEFSDISDLITQQYKKLKNDGKLTIEANYNTLQTYIQCSTDTIYFNKERSIASLLGFSKKILQKEKEYQSDKTIDITKTNTLLIECNIVSGSYINNDSAHTLHQFSLNVSPGYKITETPTNVIYLPVNTRSINTIILKVIDQDGNTINFRGEKISIRLHLKPLKE